MPYNPSERNLVPEIINNTANSLSESLAEYRKRQSQREFNSSAFETILSQYPGAVAPDIIAKFHNTTNPDAQSGIVVNMISKIKQDTEQKDQLARQKAQDDAAMAREVARNRAALDLQRSNQTFQQPAIDAEVAQRRAQANADEAKAWSLWTGEDTRAGSNPVQIDALIDPTTKKPVAGRGVNRLTGQVVDTSEAPAEGNTMGTWVKDPNDPTGTKYIGMIQANGQMKFLPRPSDLVELAQRGIIKLGEGTAKPPLQAAETPVPTATPKPTAAGPVHVKSIEEARALPPGTPFYTPQGVLKVR